MLNADVSSSHALDPPSKELSARLRKEPTRATLKANSLSCLLESRVASNFVFKYSKLARRLRLEERSRVGDSGGASPRMADYE